MSVKLKGDDSTSNVQRVKQDKFARIVEVCEKPSKPTEALKAMMSKKTVYLSRR
jgi:hypothetical protein